MARVIYLPEQLIEEHLGRRLPGAVSQEFSYDGQRYRVRQHDPNLYEGQVLCELIEPMVEKKDGKSRGRAIRKSFVSKIER